jgi:hypothetical protein
MRFLTGRFCLRTPTEPKGLHALFGWEVSADNGLGYRMITTNARAGSMGVCGPCPRG